MRQYLFSDDEIHVALIFIALFNMCKFALWVHRSNGQMVHQPSLRAKIIQVERRDRVRTKLGECLVHAKGSEELPTVNVNFSNP